MPKPGL